MAIKSRWLIQALHARLLNAWAAMAACGRYADADALAQRWHEWLEANG